MYLPFINKFNGWSLGKRNIYMSVHVHRLIIESILFLINDKHSFSLNMSFFNNNPI